FLMAAFFWASLTHLSFFTSVFFLKGSHFFSTSSRTLAVACGTTTQSRNRAPNVRGRATASSTQNRYFRRKALSNFMAQPSGAPGETLFWDQFDYQALATPGERWLDSPRSPKVDHDPDEGGGVVGAGVPSPPGPSGGNGSAQTRKMMNSVR